MDRFLNIIKNSLSVSNLVSVLLAIGILPSFTALSENLSNVFPSLFRYSGPINVLKLGLPILLYHVWSKRNQIPKICDKIFLFCLITGTLATFISCVSCTPLPSALIREWAVMVLGVLSSICFLLLEKKQKLFVLGAWTFFIYGSVVLDWFFPKALCWLYDNIFDTDAQYFNVSRGGIKLLTGVFGIQSLAKLMAWLPWILLSELGRKVSRRTLLPLTAVILFTPVLIFLTTQRGPIIGFIFGILAFGVHQIWRFKDKRTIYFVVGILFLSASAIWILVPKEILEVRIKPTFGIFDRDTTNIPDTIGAWHNIKTRKMLLEFTLNKIARNPWGDACIKDEEFLAAGLRRAHSHNLFLQQYLDRGWIWGTIHLALWILASLGAWRSKEPMASSVFAGLVTTIVLGLFDQPWFVLNHAIILGTFLSMGFWLSPKSGKRTCMLLPSKHSNLGQS